MKKLAIFDLDDTIIKGQSQKYLVKFLLRKKAISYLFLLKITFWIFLYKKGLFNDPTKIMIKGAQMAKNWEKSKVDLLMDEFFDSEIKHKVYPWFKTKYAELKKEDYVFVLATNAIKPVAQVVSKKLNFDYCLATELEEKNGFYSGKILGDIMYHTNKEVAVRKMVEKNGLSLDQSLTFSDHISDLPLLKLSSSPCVINPDPGLKKHAQENDWEIKKL